MNARIACIATLSVLLASAAATQTDTTFTYQGSLSDGGSPAEGAYDISVSLWNAAIGGAQQGITLTFTNTPVSGGVFSLDLDFGSAVFDGSQQWLQIAVEGTTLSPRQPVTRTPYAIQTRGLYVNNSETFVGVGREAPITGAEVFGVASPANGFGGMYVETGGPSGQPFYGYSVNGDVDAYHAVDGSTGDWYLVNNGAVRMTVTDTGNLGVGATPGTSARMSVSSTSGQNHALVALSADSTEPTIAASNVGGGGAIRAIGGPDVSPSGGGVLVLGSEASSNIGIDTNEIMARNNGQTSTLFLNADGGDVRMGSQRTTPPFAYGLISSNGSIISASSNVSGVDHLGPGSYNVHVSGGPSSQDIILVSGSGGGLTVANMWVDGFLYRVTTFSVSSLDDFVDSKFSFAIYRH